MELGIRVRRYHNGRCIDTSGSLFVGLPDLGISSSASEVSGFPEFQLPNLRNFIV